MCERRTEGIGLPTEKIRAHQERPSNACTRTLAVDVFESTRVFRPPFVAAVLNHEGAAIRGQALQCNLQPLRKTFGLSRGLVPPSVGLLQVLSVFHRCDLNQGWTTYHTVATSTGFGVLLQPLPAGWCTLSLTSLQSLWSNINMPSIAREAPSAIIPILIYQRLLNGCNGFVLALAVTW